MTPGVCAAICTRNRTDPLRRALRSLAVQAGEPAEILVVDNAPGGPATRNLVRDEFPAVRYVMEPIPGLDFARNRALRETSREIVAFMDDGVRFCKDHGLILNMSRRGNCFNLVAESFSAV